MWGTAERMGMDLFCFKGGAFKKDSVMWWYLFGLENLAQGIYSGLPHVRRERLVIKPVCAFLRLLAGQG